MRGCIWPIGQAQLFVLCSILSCVRGARHVYVILMSFFFFSLKYQHPRPPFTPSLACHLSSAAQQDSSIPTCLWAAAPSTSASCAKPSPKPRLLITSDPSSAFRPQLRVQVKGLRGQRGAFYFLHREDGSLLPLLQLTVDFLQEAGVPWK